MLYRDQIKHFPALIQESLIKETPHTRFNSKDLPPELAFLAGAIVDLGFENLGLPAEAFKALSKAFAGKGIRIPGTNLKLRYSGELLTTVIEPISDTEEDATLPDYWREAVLVLDHNDQPSWIGKRVRPDQVGKLDRFKYAEVEGGYQLPPPDSTLGPP